MDVLVVVDMQKDFCYENGALYIGEHVRRIFDPLRRVIEGAREREIPIVFTQDWHREDDAEFKIWPKHCIAGSEGAEIIDELDPRPGDIYVKKRRYSAFFGTDLDLTLRELVANGLIVAGVVTNICVLHTVADAVMRGYEVTVLEDCTTALNERDHEYGIEHMKNVLRAEILRSDELWV